MRKSVLILALIIVQTTFSFAQDTLVINKKVVYKNVGNRELSVDIFYTESSQQNRNNTAIAFFHGGGWVFGDPSEFYEACRRFARKGFVTFSFQYRLSRNADGTYPHPDITPVESTKDARSAIRWLRENAGTLKINPAKIVAGGQSAGGQLALATALTDSVNEISDNMKICPVPNAMLLYSSNVNTMEAWVDMLLGERRNEIWSVSPYHNLKKPMPPVIAFRGDEDDQVLPYTVEMFKAKMNKLGNYYEEYVYPGMKHYLAPDNKKYATYFDEVILEKTDIFLKKFGF
ncbi:MAG: carbohydrate [Prolixibacteraceae bacterium]|nr:MAG: carbohydrate [Prolixibacteraceae bacterium]